MTQYTPAEREALATVGAFALLILAFAFILAMSVILSLIEAMHRRKERARIDTIINRKPEQDLKKALENIVSPEAVAGVENLMLTMNEREYKIQLSEIEARKAQSGQPFNIEQTPHDCTRCSRTIREQSQAPCLEISCYRQFLKRN